MVLGANPEGQNPWMQPQEESVVQSCAEVGGDCLAPQPLHMGYSLPSSKGGNIGIISGSTIRRVQGDTWSLDPKPYVNAQPYIIGLLQGDSCSLSRLKRSMQGCQLPKLPDEKKRDSMNIMP